MTCELTNSIATRAIQRVASVYFDGRFREACAVCDEALAVFPDHPALLLFRNLIAKHQGACSHPIGFFESLASKDPTDPGIRVLLGEAYLAYGILSNAAEAFSSAIRCQPENAIAYNRLGECYARLHRLPEATQHYADAIAIDSRFAAAHCNLGIAHYNQRMLDLARQDFDNVLVHCGDSNGRLCALAHHYLGLIHRQQGDLAQALMHCEAAVASTASNNPRFRRDLAATLNALGQQALSVNQIEPGGRYFEEAAIQAPDAPEVHNNLGLALWKQGRTSEADAAYGRALGLRPDNALWQLRRAILCPNVFASADEIEAYRHGLTENLRRFADSGLRVAPDELVKAGTYPPYGLNYHGVCNRTIRELFASIFRGCFPEMGAPSTGARTSVGFVVTHSHEGAFLRCMSGIIRALSDSVVPVLICSAQGARYFRGKLGQQCPECIVLGGSFLTDAQVLRERRLHILYYWEVSTDPYNYFLPFLRLAPIQCTGWGVPCTSGIPNMDYYLSSELVERPYADSDYSENLIRAKSLLTIQNRRMEVRRSGIREKYNLPAGAHLYMCLQQIGKIHPDFDAVMREILELDPLGMIVLSQGCFKYESEKLRQRLGRTIPDADRIRFVPYVGMDEYTALLSEASLLLDPIHHGMGISTYDGLSAGKVIVTRPGDLACNRNTNAVLLRMGMPDCVVSGPDEYVTFAVSVATDDGLRSELESRVRERRHLIFDDSQSAHDFEEAIAQMVARTDTKS